MSREDRAKQFLPFASLTGLEVMMKTQEKVVSPRKEISDERAKKLDEIVSSLKKSDVVRITYYSGDGYSSIEGAATEIDTVFGRIRIIKTSINFSDIYEIKRLKDED